MRRNGLISQRIRRRGGRLEISVSSAALKRGGTERCRKRRRITLGSGAFDGPYSLRARVEDVERATNPEELLGAAEAGCFHDVAGEPCWARRVIPPGISAPPRE